MKEKRFKRLMVWDIISLAILIVFLTLDSMNADKWNITWLYPCIRIPLVLDIMIFAFCMAITLLTIIDILGKDD